MKLHTKTFKTLQEAKNYANNHNGLNVRIISTSWLKNNDIKPLQNKYQVRITNQ